MGCVPVRTESQIYAAIAANETLITALRSAVAHTLAVEASTQVIDLQYPQRSPGQVILTGAPSRTHAH